jgi:hypothetical protein
MRNSVLLSAAAVAFALAAGEASATTFDWTITVGGFSGAGTLDANPTTTSGVYSVDFLSGDVNGVSVSLLTPDTLNGNDNLIFYPGDPNFVDVGGIGALVNGVDYALYYQPNADSCGEARYCLVGLNGFGPVSADFSISETPLPAALPLFAGGLGMIGMMSRRRKRQAGPIAAA